MKSFPKNLNGFTIVELLVTIVLCSILLMAVTGLYIVADKYFKQTKPVSDVLEEMRSAMVTLDFVFSRWGAGVPCKNNKCIFSSIIPPCDGYPPSDPLCMNCVNGDLNSGCKDIEFYANIKGLGFVVSVNGTQANIISCRLSNDFENDNYYYIWQGDKVVNWNGTSYPPTYGFCSEIPTKDCINFNKTPNLFVNPPIIGLWNFNGILNCDNNTYTFHSGDIITRVPYLVKLYVNYDSDTKGYWLYQRNIDMATNNATSVKLARLKDANSFIIKTKGREVIIKITFQSQSKPEKTLTIERYFAR